MSTTRKIRSNSMEEQSAREEKLTFFDTGPGPGKYLLKSLVGASGHSLSHRIYPQWSIGQKLESLLFSTRERGPGPAVYDVPGGQRANDRFGPKRFTMKARRPIIGFERQDIPSVGTYTPVDISLYNFPKPIMLSRPKSLKKLVTPGPGACMLPVVIGPKIQSSVMPNAPCITLKGRSTYQPKPQGSGELYLFPDTLKKNAVTLKGRYPDRNNGDLPGPASYKIESKKPFQFHYGRKHNVFTGIFRTPCDNL